MLQTGWNKETVMNVELNDFTHPLSSIANSGNIVITSSKARGQQTDKPYFEATFKENDFIFFGSETAGIPEDILNKYKEQTITIPMTKEGRSLNLAISTGIVLYDAIRQTYGTFDKAK